MTWKVWITGYPDCGERIEAETWQLAMQIHARHCKALHKGEAVELNAHRGISTFRRLGRLTVNGVFVWRNG